MHRREFLALAAGSPLIFGLRELLAQESAPEKPPYFKDALLRMKELGLPGMVLVIPGTKEERDRLADSLLKRLTGDSALVRQVLTGAVLICLPAGVIPMQADDKSNRILLNSDGAKIAADQVDVTTIEDPAKFVESFNLLLHGEKGERLEARAKRAIEVSPAAIRQALKDLTSDDVAIREKATALLIRDADWLQPLLVQMMRKEESTETGLRLKKILEALFTRTSDKLPGPRLPYGTRIKSVEERIRGGVEHDPCPGCGMAVPTIRTTKFLRFLSHPDE